MNTSLVIEMYDKGMLVRLNALYELFDYVTADELENLPLDWYEELNEYVETLPTDQEGWDRMIFVQSWYGRGLPPTQEAQRQNAQQRAAILRGLLQSD